MARKVDDPSTDGTPSQTEEQIGANLREWRVSSGQTLHEVAEAASLSVGYISQVERGLANPSLETLKRLAEVLGRRVGDFFSATDLADDRRYVVTRTADRKKLSYPGTGIDNELLSPDLRRRLEVIWVEAPAGSTSGGHPHSHEGEECGVIFAGSMRLWIGDDEVVLEPGDSVYLDSPTPHRWEAVGPTDLQALWIITPPTF